jgi:hypothetical protein
LQKYPLALMNTTQSDSGLHTVPLPLSASGPSAGGSAWQHSKRDKNSAEVTAAEARAADLGLCLNGDVLACACPECRGPMSIRLWLMLADCWMCGTSVELSEEQEKAARKLLETREQKSPTVSKAPVATPVARTTAAGTPVAKRAPEPTPTPIARIPTAPAQPKTTSVPPPAAAPAPPRPRAATTIPARRRASDWLRDLPAWLASFIFHVVAMILLGLLTLDDPNQHNREILLTATLGNPGLEGGEKKPDENPDAVVIEDPGKEQAEEPKPTTPEEPPPAPTEEPVEQVAEREELPSLDDPNAQELPRFEEVKSALQNATGNRMFEGRDPRVRTQVVLAEGGSKYTEAAVAQGLRWISRHQAEDGHWSLQHFDRHGDCFGRCEGQGHGAQNVGATGLALLPFLGAGQTHTRGIYQNTVARGARWLIAQQKSNGSLIRRDSATMYEHGIASIALCELYALTQDPSLEKPAQKAIDFIVWAQHKSRDPDSEGGTGGWRYKPGEPGDTSVVGWQLMALRSGRIGGLRVPTDTFVRAGRFLDYVQSGDYGGLYAYQIHRRPEPAMIAEGLLSRQYLGWPAHHRGLREGVEHLLMNHLPSIDDPNIYYWYYGTQVMHHIGGKPWEVWNNATREALVALQEREGHEMGSWDPVGDAIHGGIDVRVGGRLYWTSLATCTLEVYYRHLPIYRGIEVDEAK